MSSEAEVIEQEVPAEIKEHLDRVNESKGIQTEPVIPNTDPKPKEEEEKPKEEGKPIKEDVEQQQNTEPVEKEPIVEEKPNNLSDDEIIKALKARNINIDSLDKILQKEEPKEEKSQEEISKDKKDKTLAWALSNKKFDSELLNEYAKTTSMSKTEIAFQLYKQQRSGDLDSEGEEITEEQLRNDFEDENFLFEEETDPKRRRAEKRLAFEVDTFINEKFSKIINAESEFDFEINESQRKEKLSSTLSPIKENIVKDGFSFSIKDELGDEYAIKIPVTKKVADKIFSDINSIPLPLKGDEADYTGRVENLFRNAIIANNFDSFLKEYATAYHTMKMEKIAAEGVGVETRKTTAENVESKVPKEIQDILDQVKAKKGEK